MASMIGLYQLISLLLLILIVYTTFKTISHINRSKIHDEQILKILNDIKNKNNGAK